MLTHSDPSPIAIAPPVGRRAQFDRLGHFVGLRIDAVDLAILRAQHPHRRVFSERQRRRAAPTPRSTCPPGWSAGRRAVPGPPPDRPATARSRRTPAYCSPGRRGIRPPLRSAPDRCAIACRACRSASRRCRPWPRFRRALPGARGQRRRNFEVLRGSSRDHDPSPQLRNPQAAECVHHAAAGLFQYPRSVRPSLLSLAFGSISQQRPSFAGIRIDIGQPDPGGRPRHREFRSLLSSLTESARLES